MRKILLVTLLIFIFSLTACTDKKPVTVNIQNGDELNNTIVGIDTMIEIGDFIYYDSTTKIVYLWNGNTSNNSATIPSPYYAPNGLPYRYNPETNSLEEIK